MESVSGYPGIRFSGVSDSSPKVALFAWRDVTLRSFDERDGRSRTQLLGFIAIFSIGARGAYCRGGQMGEAFGSMKLWVVWCLSRRCVEKCGHGEI